MMRKGFSLVEVTIALGIIAFCVISVVALLPMGMNSLQSARDRRNATEVLNLLAGDLLSQRMSPGGTNHLPGVFSNYSWTVGGTNVTGVLEVPADGRQASSGADVVTMKVHFSIEPPKDHWSAGLARLSVAWPGSARRETTNAWSGERGHADAVIYFSP